MPRVLSNKLRRLLPTAAAVRALFAHTILLLLLLG
jgi:hypothetical protein